MSNEDFPKPQDKVYHPDFDATDADVCVQSSDGIIFKLHRNNIIIHTNTLPLPEGGDPNMATFQEPAKILEILFKFMYPTPPLPDLSDLDFEMLEELGYAAHKYQMASVMAYCDTCLRLSHVSTHPARMLKYAIAHNWSEETIDTIARETIDVRAPHAWEVLGPAIYVRWSLYREKWLDPGNEDVWKASVHPRQISIVTGGTFAIHPLCVALKKFAVSRSRVLHAVRSGYVSSDAESEAITLPRFI